MSAMSEFWCESLKMSNFSAYFYQLRCTLWYMMHVQVRCGLLDEEISGSRECAADSSCLTVSVVFFVWVPYLFVFNKSPPHTTRWVISLHHSSKLFRSKHSGAAGGLKATHPPERAANFEVTEKESKHELTAIEFKDQGNRFYALHKYEDAIACYSRAIVSCLFYCLDSQ